MKFLDDLEGNASSGDSTSWDRRRAMLVWRLRRIMPTAWIWRYARFWTDAYTPEGDCHVLPWNDEIQHGGEECICGPSAELVKCPAGHDHWIYTHHAADDRGDRSLQ